MPGPNTAEQPYPRCTRLLGWQRIERKLACSPARTYGTWFCAVAVGRRPTALLAPPLPSLLGGFVRPTIPSPSLDRRRRKAPPATVPSAPSAGTGGKLAPSAISWSKPLFAALLCAWACRFLFSAFLCFCAFVSFLRVRGRWSGPRLPPCPCIIAVEARGLATKKLARQLGAHRVVEVAYVRCALRCPRCCALVTVLTVLYCNTTCLSCHI